MARNQKKDDDWKGWAIIVLLFAFGLWPVALVVLFGKLFASDKKQEAPPPLRVDAESAPRQTARTDRKTQTDGKARAAARKAMRSPSVKKSNAWLLMVIGAALAAVGLLACYEPIDMMIWLGSVSGYLEDLLYALSLTVAGFGMLGAGFSMSRAVKRYARYLAVMGDVEAISIESLSRKMGFSEKQVRRDLRKMIDKGYFGGRAYLNMELGYFFRSNEADARVARERTEAQDRRKAEASRAAENEYDRILRDIRRANDEIADPALSAKIRRLEDVTAGIFQAVQADPSKRSRIDTFLNYYLPTTQKLLDSYARFESAGVEGENLRQAKARIEKTMDSIVAGFEHQLDQLYKDDAMDVDSDIRVMETMLHRDTASVEQDFGLGGAAVQREEE